MNTRIRSRVVAPFATAVAVIVVGACGAEIEPPRQDIGQDIVREQDRPGSVTERSTPNRVDFGDEYGTAEVGERRARPAGSGTRNRMDFGDEHGTAMFGVGMARSAGSGTRNRMDFAENRGR